MTTTASLKVGGIDIVYDFTDGEGPLTVFLGGYASTRKSVKASALFAWAEAGGRPFLRFDYSGHGDSGGRFEEATLGRWLGEAEVVISKVAAARPVVLVGSSMGGWLSLLLAKSLPRVTGLVTIACAADFTEEVVWPNMPPNARAMLREKGVVRKPGEPGTEGTPLTLAFLEEAKRHLILGGSIPVSCPVRMLHGTEDRDIPWSISARALEMLESKDASLTLVKGGGHSLSSPRDLTRLFFCISEMEKTGFQDW